MSFSIVPNPRGGTGRKMRTGKARSSIFAWGVDRLTMVAVHVLGVRPAMDGMRSGAGRYDRWQGRPVRSREHKENIRNDESRARRLVLGRAMQACALRSAVDEGSRLGCITKRNSSPCVNLARGREYPLTSEMILLAGQMAGCCQYVQIMLIISIDYCGHRFRHFLNKTVACRRILRKPRPLPRPAGRGRNGLALSRRDAGGAGRDHWQARMIGATRKPAIPV